MSTTEQTAPEELVPGTPEYDQFMADKFDEHQRKTGAVVEDKPADERPSWLPEKFKSPEDLAKAYAELEKKQSQPKDEPKAEAEAAPEEAPVADDAAAREAVADAGLDFDALVSKFTEKGGLDPDDYKALEAKGIPAEVVDRYIDGQMALADQYRSQIVSVAGGEEGYSQITSWAAKNLAADEIEAFNAVIDGGDVGQMKLAVAGLKARYEAVNGSEPNLVKAVTGTSSGEVFRSPQELTAAMKDPRYKTDPAYRADVQAKLGRSSIF